MSRTSKQSASKATAKPRLGVAERLEKETATRAYRNVMAGESVTAEERSALKR